MPVVQEYLRVRMSPRLRALESESDVLQSVCGDVLAMPGIAFDDEEGFRRWLCAAVLNKVRNHDRHFHAQRRDARRAEPLPSDGELPAEKPAAASPSRELIDRERNDRLHAALQKLPEHYQEIVRRVRFDGLSYEEAAAATGRSVASVRNILARAITRLAGLLDTGRGDPDDTR